MSLKFKVKLIVEPKSDKEARIVSRKLRRLAEVEFPDLVSKTEILISCDNENDKPRIPNERTVEKSFLNAIDLYKKIKVYYTDYHEEFLIEDEEDLKLIQLHDYPCYYVYN